MRKMLFALVITLGAAEAASAQWAAPPGPGPAAGPSVYGWNPALKRNLLWWKKDACGQGGCNTGCAGGNCGPTGPMPGTLVFPQHQFVRSPRDYFMAGDSK